MWLKLNSTECASYVSLLPCFVFVVLNPTSVNVPIVVDISILKVTFVVVQGFQNFVVAEFAWGIVFFRYYV